MASTRFHLTTFGRLALTDDSGRDDPSLSTRPRKLALLAWLALRPGRCATRDRIIGVFWGDRDESRARNSLADAVSHLRRVLGRDAIPTRGCELVIPEDAPLVVDAIELSAAASRRDDARVTALYKGAFLDGFYINDSDEFDDWRDRERARFARLFAASAARRCEELAEICAWEECRALAERWLDVELASPQAGAMLLRAIAGPGTAQAHAEVLTAYQGLVRRLDRELGVAPDAEVMAVVVRAQNSRGSLNRWMQHVIFRVDDTGEEMTSLQSRRRRLSPGMRRQLWEQWKAGESLEAIAAALAVSPSGVQGEITRRGGIAPPPRCRAARTLTLAERELLARWRVGEADGIAMREGARRLGRDVSTISREIRRNGARTATSRGYDPAVADARAWERARRPKACRLATQPALGAVVAAHLAADWSPAQIAAWLRMSYPDDPTMQISAETIYRSLYVQARGALKKDLTAHLRRGRSLRRRAGRPARPHRGAIVDGLTIAERPALIDARTVPGHWEGDLVAGARNSHIASLVERASRFVVLVRVPGKDSPRVVDALIDAVQRLPTGLMASLTWDRGAELAQHKRFTVATDVQVYFCDPQSPWQRGTNENTNGLLRQYFPKGMDLSDVTQAQLDAVALKLNTRPRQTLGWATPAAALSRLMRGVALTG